MSRVLSESRVALLERLKGNVIRLPNLHELFVGWPVATNVHIEEIRKDVDDYLER